MLEWFASAEVEEAEVGAEEMLEDEGQKKAIKYFSHETKIGKLVLFFATRLGKSERAARGTTRCSAHRIEI